MNLAVFLAGTLLFTNTITYTINSSSGMAINKDSIFGTENYLSLTTQQPVLNASGQIVSTISSNSVYTLVSSDGWGYQQSVVLPAPTLALRSFVVGSLAYQTVTNLEQFTNGLSPSTGEPMFSVANWTTTTFTPNPSFWLKKALERTAIVIAHNQNGQIGASAISPRHVISCSHATMANGTVLSFVDDTGTVVNRTILDQVTVPTMPDTQLYLLDSDLPVTVHPFSLLPLNYVSYLANRTNQPATQLVGCNQDKWLFPKCWDSTIIDFVTADSSPLWLGTAWNITIRGGDSGHPIMMLVGNDLILLGSWSTASYGPNYTFYSSYINTAMHTLSVAHSLGSDYQITFYSLSAWPSY